jgi:hypothetical protein
MTSRCGEYAPFPVAALIFDLGIALWGKPHGFRDGVNPIEVTTGTSRGRPSDMSHRSWYRAGRPTLDKCAQ